MEFLFRVRARRSTFSRSILMQFAHRYFNIIAYVSVKLLHMLHLNQAIEKMENGSILLAPQ